jgi:hypothetical protein
MQSFRSPLLPAFGKQSSDCYDTCMSRPGDALTRKCYRYFSAYAVKPGDDNREREPQLEWNAL